MASIRQYGLAVAAVLSLPFVASSSSRACERNLRSSRQLVGYSSRTSDSSTGCTSITSEVSPIAHAAAHVLGIGPRVPTL